MFDAIPTTMSGWAGWVGMALVSALVYLPQKLKENRGDAREIERLISALSEERGLRREAEDQLAEANTQINSLIREFSDIKAVNAQMELQIRYLTREIESLRADLKPGAHQ